MSANGEFNYPAAGGWFAIFTNRDGIIERVGPFDTQEEAKAEREKQLGMNDAQ